MIRKETGFKIIKYKGKAVSVAMCGLFCLGGTGLANATAQDVAADATVVIANSNNPNFLGAGTATIADTGTPIGAATTTSQTTGVGNITFLGGSTYTGSLGAAANVLNTITLTNGKTVNIIGKDQFVTAIVFGGTTSILNQTAATSAGGVFFCFW